MKRKHYGGWIRGDKSQWHWCEDVWEPPYRTVCGLTIDRGTILYTDKDDPPGGVQCVVCNNPFGSKEKV